MFWSPLGRCISQKREALILKKWVMFCTVHVCVQIKVFLFTRFTLLVAHPSFRILATMNPGGDFGKKELSPALRNRFTEIWVPAIADRADIIQIINDRFTCSQSDLIPFAHKLLEFVSWFNEQQCKMSNILRESLFLLIMWVELVT